MIAPLLILALAQTEPAQTEPKAVSKPGYTAPRLVKIPDDGQLSRVVPSLAAKKRVNGSAKMECVVTPAGTLKSCKVVSESPPGLGYGAAALALAPVFKLQPATQDGVPVESVWAVRVNWPNVATFEPTRSKLLVGTPWFEAPTRADVAAVAPSSVRGAVTLLCEVVARTGRLRDCKPSDGKIGPLSAAARKLAPKFRTVKLPADQARKVESVFVNVTVLFSDQADAVDLAGVKIRAREGEFEPAPFPAAARAAGVKSGRAVMTCDIGPNGVPTACDLKSESPPGLGFGDAARTAIKGLAISAWTAEGRPVDGSRLDLPLAFEDDDPSTP